MSNYVGAEIEATVNSRAAVNALKDAVLEAVRVVFTDVMVEDAKQNCPMGPAEDIRPGSEKNAEHNRDSIAAKAFMSRKGPFGKLYTESGHGGFLEVGTEKMTAQPYIWPAFQKNIGALMGQIKTNVENLKVPTGETVELGRVIADSLS